ncbi:NCA2 family protein [Aspergillus undulatus]|uniref:NCA2 family protein n=1 Tax=Aspergillus undulatus TaxID=1810928 RepID=UPI003CCD1D87
MESGANDGHAFTSRRTANDLTFGASSAPSAWPRYYTLVQRYMSTTHSLAGLGILPSLSRLKLEVQSKRKKLKAMRDYNASAVGLLIEECFSFEVDLHAVDNSRSLTNCDLCQRVRANVSLLKVILGNAGVDNATLEHATIFIGSGDNALRGTEHVTDVDPSDPQGIIQELVHILTDLLPRYKQISVEGISAFGRPSPAVRYWLPLSFALVSATTSLKIARNVGPALIESISNFGNTALDFWKNWVVEPMWKLVRTIRHDEASEIALMSKNSLEADRASLERMVVDFVLDRGEQSHSTSSADIIVDKVREGDLTPVLRAYEKDLRSPFLGTVRGDLVRALLIQIQKTKVDVEVAMNGIDALLRSQELVFGFVGLTPGLLISYASIRWFFGLIGNRRGFRLGRRQDVLRYALRKIHCILSKSSLTEEGRLDYRNHGLLICNAEVLLGKARTMLKGEDLRAFREDTSDLIDEDRVDKQLQIIERMAWTYSKWM